jgi:hypothetical protein
MNQTPAPKARSPQLSDADQGARAEAQELLASAGSDQAQRAVESAVGPQNNSQQDAFARQWKFGSYLEMFEASKPLATLDGKPWLVTNIGNNQWIVWNEQDLTAAYTVASVEEAKELLNTPTPGGDKPDKAPPTG